jgi:hypothetical protein
MICLVLERGRRQATLTHRVSLLRSLDPFIDFHIVDADPTMIDTFKVNLLLIDHINKGIVEDNFFVIDLQKENALF